MQTRGINWQLKGKTETKEKLTTTLLKLSFDFLLSWKISFRGLWSLFPSSPSIESISVIACTLSILTSPSNVFLTFNIIFKRQAVGNQRSVTLCSTTNDTNCTESSKNQIPIGEWNSSKGFELKRSNSSTRATRKWLPSSLNPTCGPGIAVGQPIYRYDRIPSTFLQFSQSNTNEINGNHQPSFQRVILRFPANSNTLG